MQMQPTNFTNLKNKQVMLNKFTTPPFELNPDAMKHFFIAQFHTIRTSSDDAHTEVLTLELNHQTREDLDQDWEKTQDSIDREIRGITAALKHYMQDSYGPESVNTIHADQATILENKEFQSTMLITHTDLALHIVHTYQY